MNNTETCINQTLLIYCCIVVVELFVIAYLLSFPWIILTSIILYRPVVEAMNWPMPVQNTETITETRNDNGKD